jgi:hypothetical protein
VAGTRAGLRAVTAVAVLLGAVASPASAADSGARVLTEAALGGVTVDLDADGAREIVAIVADQSGQDLVAWREADGAWESLGSVRLERSAAGGPGLRPLSPTDASGLVLANDGARQRAILATSPTNGERLAECCLTLFEVALRGDELDVQPIGRNLGLASSIASVDLEGDGRDELVVAAPVDPAGPEAPFENVRLLRWLDGGIMEASIPYPEDAGLLVAIGDSDGMEGEELHFMAGRVVTRVAADGDDLLIESGVLPDGTTGLSGEWIAGATAGVLITIDGTSRVAAFRWPRGGQPSPSGSLTTGPFPSVFVLGEGKSARIVAMGSTSRTEYPMRTQVFDLDLELEGEVVPVPAVEAMLEVAESEGMRVGDDTFRARPQFGPLNSSPDHGAAFLVPGSLLELTGDGELSIRPTVPFAGEGSLGLAGADAAWLVSGLGWNSFYQTSTYLYAAGHGTRLAVVPIDSLVGSPDGSAPDVTISGGALVDTPNGSILYAGGDGVRISVRASPGAWAFARGWSSTEATAATEDRTTLDMRFDVTDDRAAPGQAIVVVVEPGGIAQVATWDAVVLDGPPDLRAASAARPFGVTSTVSGRVLGPATVTVDGAPIAVRPDGSFTIEVDAPIWGRDVLVRAVDPLGQETVQQLTVVGFVDYRGLPWLPIIGVLTVAIGLVLFVRVPRMRPVPATVPVDGDGRLEELDEDHG